MDNNGGLRWGVFYRSWSNGRYLNVLYEPTSGKYYLGGKKLQLLLFRTRAEAEKEAKKVKKDEWFKMRGAGNVFVSRFRIEPNI